MYLIDEQDVARLQLGEDGRQIARTVEGRTRGHVEFGLHLGGHDVGQRRLAQSGRPGEQEVVGSLTPPSCRLEHHPQVALQLGLAHELLEAAGPQATFDRLLVDLRITLRREKLLAHDRPAPTRVRT